MTRVKICGIRDEATAIEAAKAGADFVGLVFAESKRQVSPQSCHAIMEAIQAMRRQPGPAVFSGPARGEISARTWFHAWNEALEDAIARFRPIVVGVFAGQPLDDVNDIAETAGLDLVQLSGAETSAFASRVSRPVVLTRHVAPGDTAEEVLDGIDPGPAAILLDTASPGARGGTGETFDWTVAGEIAARMPVILAGGLRPDNVAEAIARVRPWAVDVSSGVESGGAKDVEKIRAFIRAAKGTGDGR